MSGASVPVNIEILEKEYKISCREDEKEALLASAKLLNDRMQQVRKTGKVLGTERMAVITALNIIHELSQERREQEAAAGNIDREIDRLEDKVRAAISRRSEVDPID